jgi:hypothetical protein
MTGLPDRFWAKVDKTDDGCWKWTAATKGKGYGNFWMNGGFYNAHRLSWEDVNGPIPDGLVIDHLCRNPPCVRPDHLRVVTQRENLFAEGSLFPAKLNAEKTHCPHGHLFTPESTYVRPNGWRECNTCRTEWHRQRRRAARERQSTS